MSRLRLLDNVFQLEATTEKRHNYLRARWDMGVLSDTCFTVTVTTGAWECLSDETIRYGVLCPRCWQRVLAIQMKYFHYIKPVNTAKWKQCSNMRQMAARPISICK
jgi:hypothetical protein